MADWSFYDYSPSKAAAIVTLICYGASAGYHVFLTSQDEVLLFHNIHRRST